MLKRKRQDGDERPIKYQKQIRDAKKVLTDVFSVHLMPYLHLTTKLKLMETCRDMRDMVLRDPEVKQYLQTMEFF